MSTELFSTFSWLNQSKITNENGKITIAAHPNSDYFVDLNSGNSKGNAAFYNILHKGDFVLKAKVLMQRGGMSRIPVITSYSIHYTKLYDSSVTTAQAAANSVSSALLS